MKSPILSIVVPTRNRPLLALRTLEQIYRGLRNCPGRNLIEVIVSDNSSEQDVAVKEACEDFKFKHQFSGGKLNAIQSWNFSISAAIGRFVWLIADDDFPLDNSITIVLNTLILSKRDDIVYLLPFVRFYYDDVELSNGGMDGLVKSFGTRDDILSDFSKFRKVFHSSGCIVSKRIIKKVSGDLKSFFVSPFPDYSGYLGAIWYCSQILEIDSATIVAGNFDGGCGMRAFNDRERYWTEESGVGFSYPEVGGPFFYSRWWSTTNELVNNIDQFPKPNMGSYYVGLLKEVLAIRKNTRTDPSLLFIFNLFLKVLVKKPLAIALFSRFVLIERNTRVRVQKRLVRMKIEGLIQLENSDLR